MRILMFACQFALLMVAMVSTKLDARDFTINNTITDSVFIGIDNLLEINISKTESVTTIRTPAHVKFEYGDLRGKFILRPTRPSSQFQVYLLSGQVVVDSIMLSAHRIGFDVGIICSNADGFYKIHSGVFTREEIQTINEIYVDVNIPWITVPVYGYHIVIKDIDEVLLDKPVLSGSLKDPHIYEIIDQLKAGAVIEIDSVEADIPPAELDNKIILLCK